MRTEPERDRGRLHYSPYLRRLAGVTQVVSPELTSSKLHSRASHTHKVAMISREIAENLTRRALEDGQVSAAIAKAGGLDVTACEAAGLAHDLGHPPFGHAGESELNRLLRSRGLQEGFEGNAQSFRIVCVLDRHGYEEGLDLTNVVLAAISKYPWTRRRDEDSSDPDEQSKFGAYESEAEHLNRARQAVLPNVEDSAILEEGGTPPQSLEASIMDLADDIAYSVHDLEDFCSQGFIDIAAAIDSLEQYLVTPQSSDNIFAKSALKLEQFSKSEFDQQKHLRAAKRVHVLLEIINTPMSSQADRDDQLRGHLGEKIAEFFAAIIVSDAESPTVSLRPEQWHEMQILKQVTKHYLIATSRMAQIQRAQRQTIERLFIGTEQWIRESGETGGLPETLRKFLAIGGVPIKKTTGVRGAQALEHPLDPTHYRAIADYICTMSDSEAFLRAQWVTGTEIPGMANLGLVD